MLTAKHMDPNGGQFVIEVESAQFSMGDETGNGKWVRLNEAGGAETVIETGRVFIMNSAGATVADYWLPDEKHAQAA